MCASSEPEVVWVDIDSLLHMQHLPQQSMRTSSKLESQLIARIIDRLTKVRQRCLFFFTLLTKFFLLTIRILFYVH